VPSRTSTAPSAARGVASPASRAAAAGERDRPVIGEGEETGIGEERRGGDWGVDWVCPDLGFHRPAAGDESRRERTPVAPSDHWILHIVGPRRHRLAGR
jgi:hypothetical protein